MEAAMASRTEFDFSTLDYQALSPAERRAVVQVVVRGARVARAKEIAAVVHAAWQGVSRTGALGWRILRPARRAASAATLAAWQRHQERRRLRRAAAQLYAMDDRALRDIGLRRGEIEFAVSGALDPTRRPRAGNRARGCVEALRPKQGPQPTQRLAA
jgi:uncharacterized protein YjiS (DUF1127 family)